MKKNIVEIKNLSVFRKDKKVLDDINFSIKEGEFVYLRGKIGSGKSSLFRILYADISFAEGNVKVAGYDLNNIRKKEIPFLRRKLGIIFQDYKLLTDRNIFGNLKFILRASGINDRKLIRNKIDNVLKQVSLFDKKYNMPFELSGGEQQCLVIAGALINSPILILADEPTGNLDPEISTEIMKILFEITKTGTAVIFATHDYDLIKKFPARTFAL